MSTQVAASADTATKKDARRDAPAQIDVAKATYTYDTETVSVEARIPGLGRSGDASLSISQFEIFEAGYVGRIQRAPGKAPKVGLFYFDHFNLKKRKCGGVEGTWKAGRIRIAVPVTCLMDGFPADQVFAQFAIAAGKSVDRAPAVKRLPQMP
jgi:hypothetical protein